MRSLAWFTVGFAAACAAGVYLVYGHWFILLGVVLIAAMSSLMTSQNHKRKKILTACAGAAAASVLLWTFDTTRLEPVRKLDSAEIQEEILITDYSCQRSSGISADGRMSLGGQSYPVKIYLYDVDSLKPGDRVRGTWKARYTGLGGDREATYHQGKGIFLLLYGHDDAQILQCDAIPGKFFPSKLRRDISEMIRHMYPEDTAGFALALLLGDDQMLSYETDAALRSSGIRHIIAVSGLHISILFGVIYMLCGKRKWPTAVFGIPALFLFSAVAGFTPSVVRACLMQMLMILAILFDKEYDPPTALAFAVLVLLGMNPMTVTSVSFQLSVGCMAGILTVSGRIKSYLMNPKRWGRIPIKSKKGRFVSWVAASVSVTVGAMIFTTPLCAWYFGSVSLIGILTNLLTLWAVSLSFNGIIISCILGAIWAPAGIFIAKAVSLLIRYCIFISSALGKLALSSVYTDNIYIFLWIAFCYILMIAFVVTRQKRPWMVIGCMLIGLAVSISCAWLEPRLDRYRVTVLDVGQGQSVLLQCHGKSYLVDCGSHDTNRAADTVSRLLISQGIFRLDGLILTHYDSDHCNGVSGLLSRIPAEELYLPDIYDDNGLREEIEEENKGNITWIRTIQTFPMNGGSLTVFPAEELSNDNDSGLCVLFQPEGYDILITGDRSFSGEKALMETTDLPKLELLVVGHHGSKNSTGLEFLQETCPAAAAISVGKRNPYGHPADETLTRLELFGCRVFRTDLDGTIIFRG